MPPVTQLHDLTALEQAAAVRAGEVRPTELVEHYLARIAAHDAGLGAFVTVTAERALRAAAGAERAAAPRRRPAPAARRADRDQGPEQHRRRPDHVRLAGDGRLRAPVDDAVVEQLAAAGTISLGKTNTPEFGFPCYTENALAGPARCAVGPRPASAGGSSGGAAVAVAAGLRAVRAGQRRRRLDPHPGEHLRAGRHQADPRPGQQRAPRRGRHRVRPQRSDRPHRRATRPRCSTRWPGRCPATRLGAPAAGRRDLPRVRRPAARHGCGSAASSSRPSPASASSPRWRRRSTTPRRCSQDLGHDVEDVPPGLVGPEVLPVLRARVGAVGHHAAGAARAGRRPAPADPRAAGARPGDVGAGGDGGAGRAAAVRPPLRPGDGRLRRPAGAGLHDDAPAAGLVRATATAPRTSSGRSATPRSPRSTTSPASRRSACRCTGRRTDLPVGTMLVGPPGRRGDADRAVRRSSRTPGRGRTATRPGGTTGHAATRGGRRCERNRWSR